MGWDSDSEHSSEDEEGESTNTISYVLITIDCDEAMFIKEENNDECIFKTVLKSCYDVLDNILMKGGKRGLVPIAIAVVSEDIDTMSLCDFKDNLPTTIKKFRELCEMTDQELKSKYKRDDKIQLSNFFMNCKRKLAACGQELPKYITYITNHDNPIGNDDDDRRLCVNHAKTFKELKIYLELISFNPYFDLKIFFEEILESANCKFRDDYFTDSIQLKDKLMSLLTYRGIRALFFPFKNNNFFEVIEKRYIKPHKILNNVIVTKDKHEEVLELKKGVVLKDTYSVKYNKSENPITLTEAERDALVYDDIPAGYTLLGTYKGDLIDRGVHSSDPKFIRSNKHRNSPHFDIFWQYCVDNKSKLVCARKYKKGSSTKLVQLTPKVVNGIRSFLVMGIPFYNDIQYQAIHNPLYEEKPTDDPNITKAAEDLVIALDFEYNYLKIHDTVNCKKWEYIRSELLEEKQRDVPNVRDLNVIEKDVSEVVEAFKQLTHITGIKRKATYKRKPSKK